MFIKCVAGGLFLTNCYIIGDEETKEAVLIDPGEQVDDILREVKNSGMNIKSIVNTHTHIDHVAGVAEVKKQLNVPFYIHRKEQPVLDLLPESAKRFPQFGDVEVPEVDDYLEEGDSVEIGKLKAEILLVPGHTWGSICLLFRENECVISGDTLFAGSVGRVDLTGGSSMEELIGQIKEKLINLPGSYNVLPGHGPTTTIETEKRTNPFIRSGGLLYF